MTENTKTISILIIAGAVLSLALITKPRPPASTTESIVGKPLFPAFDDPGKVLKAKRLRIVSVDDRTGAAREFTVEQKNGIWTLPAYKDYPADAGKQLPSTAAALANLTVLDQVGKGPADHELYGVVEPKPGDEQVVKKGVGKLVVIDDGEGTKPVARLIIGKEDKKSHTDDFTSGNKELHFVRIAGQDPVYRVALKNDKFSTKFEDWVETDLLKLKTWDVTEAKLRDYTVTDLISPSGEYAPKISRHADIDLAFDDSTSKWDLKKLVDYNGTTSKEVKLAPDEELNLTALNDMKTALGNLKIVNVSHKPERLSADLKAARDFVNQEAFQDLVRRGFPLVPSADKQQLELRSNDGEVTIGLKDGVEYVLRFGAEVISRNTSSDNKDADEKKDDASEATKDATADAGKSDADKNDKSGSSTSRQRYIMVMAQFNQDLIPKPTLEPVPENKPSADSSAAAKSENGKAETKSSDSKAAAAKSAGAKGDAKTTADAKKSADAKKGEEAKSNEKKSDDKKSDEAKADKKADDKTADEKKADKPAEEDADVKEAERERVEKQNRVKQDEYNDKVKQGQDRVKELNARFADWYYVVSDETYRKIHLGQDQIIKKKPPEKAADAATPANPFPPAKAAPTKSGKK